MRLARIARDAVCKKFTLGTEINFDFLGFRLLRGRVVKAQKLNTKSKEHVGGMCVLTFDESSSFLLPIHGWAPHDRTLAHLPIGSTVELRDLAVKNRGTGPSVDNGSFPFKLLFNNHSMLPDPQPTREDKKLWGDRGAAYRKHTHTHTHGFFHPFITHFFLI